MLIDTHTHLMLPEFDADREEVIRRALDAGVDRIVVIGIDLATSRAAVDLAVRYDGLYATVGIHPCSVSEAAPDHFSEIESLTGHPKVVGVGETGIDLYWDPSTYPRQEEAFRWHIGLGRRAGLPIVVHDREAHTEVLAILSEECTPENTVVLHCFTGDALMAQQAAASGYYLGFGGNVTFKNTPLAGAVRAAPIERILIETDAPYLSPVPYRGRRNEPAYAVHTARAAADFRGMPFEALATAATCNASRVFRLG